jgi:hypothetical protein
MKIECRALVDIPEYTGLDSENNKAHLTIKDGEKWEGDRWGQYVGRIYEDGRIKSAFTKDCDSSDIFNRLRKDVELVEKHVTVCDNGDYRKLVGATDYYIPYLVEGHCSLKPTIKDGHVDNCSNVKYKVTYEVLFVADEGFTRYLTFDYTTFGTYSTSFWNQTERLEEELEEIFENGEHDFRIEDGEKQVAFYNEVGEKFFIDLYSVNELLSMIASIRVIGLETEIIEDK